MVPLTKRIRTERTIKVVSFSDMDAYNDEEGNGLTPDEALEYEHELGLGDKYQWVVEMASVPEVVDGQIATVSKDLEVTLTEEISIVDVKEDGTYTVDRAARY